MTIRFQPLTRRSILRGFGAGITLPWLEMFAGRTRAAAAGGRDPARLACFYVPGCINQYQWFPQDTGFEYTISPTHQPLAHHRERFSVLSGLSHIEGRISGHPHAKNFLTGHNIYATPGVESNTVSMDQVAAKHVGPTYLSSLALSYASGSGTTTLSRNELGVDLPAIGDHRTVFENLFPPADAAHLTQAKARIALNRSVLDTAVGDVKALQRQLGHADRQRLDQYLVSIRDVEKRLDDRAAIFEKGRPAFDEAGVKTKPTRASSMQEHIELMMDLIVLAFQTDMTRVATQSLGGEAGPAYDEYAEWAKATGAPTRGVHDYHHKGSGNRGADNPDMQLIALRDRLYCASLARMMDKLAAIEASEGSLLDHTVLLLGGSQITSHGAGSFPLLLAGGNRLGFRHGQHVSWKSKQRSASDLYLTILQQMRCPVASFKESKGPIAELLT